MAFANPFLISLGLNIFGHQFIQLPMKRVYIFIFLYLGCLSGFATIQIFDKLIYNGKEYKLNDFYLESFFEKYPDKRPEFRTTALWRGYVATFEIEDNQLFVTNIEIESDGEDGRIVMKTIFDKIFPGSKKVKVDWFSGIFLGGFNDKPRRYFNEFDNYCLFEIKEGDIIKNKELKEKEYKKFKKQQAQAFEKTEEYQTCLKKIKGDHTNRIKEMKEYEQNMLDTLKVRLSQSEMPNENTQGNKELKEYTKELEKSIDSYASIKELSDKEVKEVVYNQIFSFIPQFIE